MWLGSIIGTWSVQLHLFACFTKVGLCDLRPVLCLWMLPYELLNAWNNLYETWYAYHGTWAHLNGILYKSLPSVWVSVCVCPLLLKGNGLVKCIPPFSARQLISKHVPAAMNTHNNRRIVGHVAFYAVCVFIRGESVGLTIYPPIIARWQLSKDIPIAMKNC
jgi:hypothetical protein